MLLFMDKPILQQSPKGFRYMTHEQYHGVCEKPSQVKVKVVFLSAVWYTGQAVKILKKQKAVLSEKRTKRRNEVYYGFSKNERGRRGCKDHSWY